MSLIIEAAVITSAASALISVASAILAKHKVKKKNEIAMQIEQAEHELHEAYLELRSLKDSNSDKVKESINLLFRDIDTIKNTIAEEHNKQMQPTQKTRG